MIRIPRKLGKEGISIYLIKANFKKLILKLTSNGKTKISYQS